MALRHCKRRLPAIIRQSPQPCGVPAHASRRSAEARHRLVAAVLGSRMVQLASTKGYLMGSVASLLVACASGPPNSQPLAPRFYGVWSNPGGSNDWLEIDAGHFVSFAVTPSNGRCVAIRADTVARDRVILPVCSLGVGPMSLSMDGAVLVIVGKYATQRFVRTSRAAICREPGGNYLPGAPHTKQES